MQSSFYDMPSLRRGLEKPAPLTLSSPLMSYPNSSNLVVSPPLLLAEWVDRAGDGGGCG